MTAHALEDTLRSVSPNGLVAYLTAGFPTLPKFLEHLRRVAEVADAVEVGIPFTDPLADGPVLQATGLAALEAGFTLEALFDALDKEQLAAPTLVMSYLNPLLAHGDRLVPRLVQAGVSGVIVPDLPLEEGGELAQSVGDAGLALVQLVAPTTPQARALTLAKASRGFVYAITARGTTGGDVQVCAELASQLAALRAAANAPVFAGFGVRRRAQVEALSPHADGVIVGSALMDTIAKNEDPIAFLKSLKG